MNPIIIRPLNTDPSVGNFFDFGNCLLHGDKKLSRILTTTDYAGKMVVYLLKNTFLLLKWPSLLHIMLHNPLFVSAPFGS